jgi:hypothetical protein
MSWFEQSKLQERSVGIFVHKNFAVEGVGKDSTGLRWASDVQGNTRGPHVTVNWIVIWRMLADGQYSSLYQ